MPNYLPSAWVEALFHAVTRLNAEVGRTKCIIDIRPGSKSARYQRGRRRQAPDGPALIGRPGPSRYPYIFHFILGTPDDRATESESKAELDTFL